MAYDIIFTGKDVEIEASNLRLNAAVNITGAATLDGALTVTGACALSSTLSAAGLTNTAGVTLGGQVEIGTSGAGLGTIANSEPIAFYNFADGTAFLPLAPVDNQLQLVKNINGTGTLTLSGPIDGATEIAMVTMDAWIGVYDSSGTTWRTINTYTA